MTASAYVTCATPRSGSTLLCDWLTGCGAGQPGSYWRSQDIGRWAERWGVAGGTRADDPEFNRAYLAAMVRAGTAGTDVFGLRIMWGSVGEATERMCAALGGGDDFAALMQAAFGRTLYVHLSRDDTLAQAVSLVRAEQTGLWHVAADGSERQRTAAAREPVFDADRISAVREALTADAAAWTTFFETRGVRHLRLRYETLVRDPAASVRTILRELGRDPARADHVRAQTRRMADAVSANWIERMRAEP